MSVKACRQELPNKGVKLTALRAAAYAKNVRPSKHDATSGLAKRLDKRRSVDRFPPVSRPLCWPDDASARSGPERVAADRGVRVA